MTEEQLRQSVMIDTTSGRFPIAEIAEITQAEDGATMYRLGTPPVTSIPVRWKTQKI